MGCKSLVSLQNVKMASTLSMSLTKNVTLRYSQSHADETDYGVFTGLYHSLSLVR